ncbi:hypothetical protein EHLJMEHL_00944 [Vreelandella titanicae]
MTANKLFLNDQGELSQCLLPQPLRQFLMAAEKGR